MACEQPTRGVCPKWQNWFIKIVIFLILEVLESFIADESI